MLKVINKYLTKLSHYPRLRVLLIVLGAAGAFVLVMNLLRPSDTGATLPSNVEAATPAAGSKTRPASASEAANYNQLNNQATQQQTQEAAATGSTIFQNAFAPTTNAATSSPSTSNAATSTNSSPATNTSSQTNPQASSFAAANAAMQGSSNPQDAALSQQVQALQQQLAAAQNQSQSDDQAAQQQQITAMQSGIQNLSSSWNSPTLSTVTADASSDNPTPPAYVGPVAIKAGTVLYGVIDTALDSDQPNTPVLAHIVEGTYQGARLMGGFTTSLPSAGADGALVIQFTTMSMASVASTFPINAYAIDAATGNNSVVTSVNNHYLLRYGMLFASSFLQGFGNAYQSYTYNCPPGTQNCSVVNTDSSGTTNNAVTPTTKTAFYQGLGQMGQNAAQAAAQEFNTPPTIKVAQGTGIGVLFMSDLIIPSN